MAKERGTCLGGGVTLRITRHDDGSTTIERVIGKLVMPPVTERKRTTGITDRVSIVVPQSTDRLRSVY